MSDRKPPLARDLSRVQPRHTWKEGDDRGREAGGEAGAPDGGADDELLRLRARVATLTDALEDVVALALSGADYKERAIMMHRRAIAALSGVPVSGASASPPADAE